MPSKVNKQFLEEIVEQLRLISQEIKKSREDLEKILKKVSHD